MSRCLTQFISFSGLALLTLGAGFSAFAAPAVRQFPPGLLRTSQDLPPGRLRQKIESLPAPAKERALAWLGSFHFTEQDLPFLNVDSDGGVYYQDTFLPTTVTNEPVADPLVTAATSVPVVPFPAGLVFHSRPGAPNVIYLDFDGETVTGTQWNTDLARNTIVAVPFSADSDSTTYSDAEQAAIKRIWERVSEDYAPFNVDVTTERPAIFTTRTAQALITRSSDASGAANPSSTGGGVAYVNVFATSGYAKVRPAWIYFDNLGNQEGYIAEAAAHEVGHNFGLSHDGTSAEEYYGGHGSGETSWGPIMGTGYGRNVSQWSKGEYYLASNTQEDLAILSAKAPYIADDYGSTLATAGTLQVTAGGVISSTTPENDPTRTNTANKGMIERPGDVDMVSFTTGAGAISLQVRPWISPANTRGGNLDVSAALLDSLGNVLLTNNAASSTIATLQTTLPAGTYYVRINGTGVGDPFSSTPDGYTAYGSLGQYFISGTIQPTNSTSTPAETYTVNYPTPYSWLTTNGFSGNLETVVTNIGANGYPIWQSYIAGLNPNDSSSRLMLAVRKSGSAAVLNWNPVTGRVYTVQQATTLNGPYTNLTGAVSLPATVSGITNNNPGAAIFFRIKVDKL